MTDQHADVWLFGYGSLIVRPPELPTGIVDGKESLIVEQRPAVVADWVRRFWQGSPDHRGTPDRLGRVATMLRWPGKSCTGIAYRLRAGSAAAVLAALDERQVRGYTRVSVPVRGGLDQAPFAEAVAYVAMPSNPDFLGLASPAAMAAQVRDATGVSGANIDYVLSLAAVLRSLGESSDDEVFELESLLLADPP